MAPFSAPSPALDLLTLQRRWVGDADAPPTEHDRFAGVRLVGTAASGTWRVMRGSTLPAHVLARLDEVLASEPPGPSPTSAVLDVFRPEVDGGHAPRVEGGPVYLFPGRIDLPPPAGADVVTSADADAPGLAAKRPMAWDDGEWRQLVAGGLGPWVAAVVDGEVVSLCHTPKTLPPLAAECGVWTDPRFRGRQLGRTVTGRWSKLLDGTARHLFYSHDHRNDASRAVARALGLRHLGWEWTISTEPWPEGDAWGDALLDHWRGAWTPTPELEVDGGGVGAAMHPEWFFRRFAEWDWWEQELLPLAARSPALDLGAGAGRVALWLQDRGVEVTAVESSPGAARVCSNRGVADVRTGDLNEPPADKPWRAIFLLCGNLGLGGSFPGIRRLLTRLAAIAAPDAVIVADSVEPRGRPEIGLRIRYRGTATPRWRQYNVPVAEIPSLVDGTGWMVDRHVVDLPDHAVLLRRT